MSEEMNTNVEEVAVDENLDLDALNEEAVAEEPAADLDLDALTQEIAEDTAEDTAEATEVAEEAAEEEDAYEKSNNFSNSDDYLRKFSESFSMYFVLSPDILKDKKGKDLDVLVNMAEYKKKQDEKKAESSRKVQAALDEVKKQMHSN